ncbi:M14 family zinc carboxypeptidase [Actinomadura violacea]|nr:M14 family zinc carboxypeptidase [Actinomadura violacea]
MLLGAVVVFAATCGGAGSSVRGGKVAASEARRVVPLGRSVQGRPISAVELGNRRAGRRVLVVGCVHGDEPAGTAVADALAAGPGPAHADLWVVRSLNPDGTAAGTRDNARGVDLNRNFPAGWRRIDAPGSVHYSGAKPLSEPESVHAARLVRRVRPTVGIWFHQHLAVVDGSEGPKEVERRFAADVGLPLRALPDFAGSATRWENTVVRDSAFVVELPAGRLSPEAVRRYAEAVRRITGP